MSEELEKIISKYDFPKRNLKPLVDIGAIESFFNLKLPKDYVFYAENYLGIDQFIGVEFINLWNIEEIIEANKRYKIIEQLPRTIGIGSNGSGEYIGIEIDKNENINIILTALDLDSEYNTEIGSSFTDFLIRLDNGIDWFS